MVSSVNRRQQTGSVRHFSNIRIPITEQGKVSIASLVGFLLVLSPVAGILGAWIYTPFVDEGPSSLLLTLPTSSVVIVIVYFIWRWFRNSLRKENTERVAELKTINANPHVPILVQQFGGLYSKELIGDTLSSHKYWTDYYVKKGKSVDSTTVIDDVVGDLLDTYNNATPEMVAAITERAANLT